MLASWHSVSWPHPLFGRRGGSGCVLALRLEEILAFNPDIGIQSMALGQPIGSRGAQNFDSMWMLLSTPWGLLALGAFLGVIFFCIWRDQTARPLLGLFLLCSLTLNPTEMSPLSLLLAVAVRHSLPLEA